MSPRLFDGYDAFRHRPAAWFVLPVVRRPARRVATCFSGGYAASGVTGRAAEDLRIGDHVWFRHAKAGELCERVDRLLLVSGTEVVDEVPTYRGKGRAFG